MGGVIWGRHYFSRSDVRKQTAACPHCGRVSILESFDAYQWGHLYFIPLIPTGRSHVQDRCRRCERLYVVSLPVWDVERRNALEQIREHYDRDRNNQDFAFEALGLATMFDTPQRATDIATHIERSFRNQPDVMARLVAWYGRVGQLDRAAGLMNDTSILKVGGDSLLRLLGEAAINAKEFLQAKRFLLRLAEPTERPDFASLFVVASSLASRGQDREAAEVYQFLFNRFPDAVKGHSTALRGAAKLETRLGQPNSIIPEGVNPRKDMYIGLGIVAFLVLAAFIANMIFARRQSLYVVNPTKTAARIRVDDHEVRVEPNRISRVMVTEGKHAVRVVLDNGYRRDLVVDVHNSLFQRWTLENAFVYDVLGAGAFGLYKQVYSKNRSANSNDEGLDAFVAGREFYSFRSVDDPFTTPPASISSKSAEEVRVVLFRIEDEPHKIVEAVTASPNHFPGVDARAFAEGQIMGGNRDAALVRAYVSFCRESWCEQEAMQLLEAQGIQLN